MLTAPAAAQSTQARAPVDVTSPDGTLSLRFTAAPQQQLQYQVRWHGRDLAAPAPVGVTVDNQTWGKGVQFGKPERSAIDEPYKMLGGKSVATDRCNALRLSLKQDDIPGLYLEARAYNDGVAWRIGSGVARPRHVQSEVSEWQLPAHSTVWFPERNNPWKLKSYAGEYISTPVENLLTVSSQGPVQAAPLVLQLSDGSYELITEAQLANYSGMRLRALSGLRLQVDFTEGEKGFDVAGPLISPWRVTLLASDLNTLVNSDIVSNLNPAPDPKLFADTSYIRPGRAVWRYWSRNVGTEPQEEQFVDYAAELGFEYSLVDDGWKDWPDAWTQLTALCKYAATKRVGILAWQDYKYISDAADDYHQLREFLDRSRTAGLAGVKIDFFNAESKDRIDFQHRALQLAAERHLMVDFHGIQKPTGESRTYPNAITREGVRGIELNKMTEGPITPSHNAALPFTRFIAGPGDYTPLSYTWPGATTWAHQLATLIAFTSPLQTIVEDPEILLHDAGLHDALDVEKAIPTTWDETVVLQPSDIGKLAVIARRKGNAWFLAVLNGQNKPVPLPPLDLSFLGSRSYHAIILSSPERRSFARHDMPLFTAKEKLGSDASPIQLSAGDGLVAWFRPN